MNEQEETNSEYMLCAKGRSFVLDIVVTFSASKGSQVMLTTAEQLHSSFEVPTTLSADGPSLAYCQASTGE